MNKILPKPEKNIPHNSLVCHASFHCKLSTRFGTCGQQKSIFVCHLTGQQQGEVLPSVLVITNLALLKVRFLACKHNFSHKT